MTQSDIINENFSKLKSRKRNILQKYEISNDTAIYNELNAMKINSNKTGVDQIKKDDYTIVGSPTISEYGVASGFSNGNYIYKSIAISSTNQIFEGSFNINSASTEWLSIFNVTQHGEMRVGLRYRNAQLTLVGFDTKQIDNNIPFTDYNKSINYKIVVSPNEIILYLNGEYKTKISSSSLKTTSDKIYIGIGEANFGPLTNGQIDLNTIKIYVDNNLVYQPTLRIPYTQSKTGEKIVDAVYRDRVDDMYKQFGYTHYYTIGDADYTLQTVPNDQLVDSHYADNSFMELTADLSLTQGGGAISGQTVNLKRPYVNNKYIATIGTSSKATNSFVASASGQWISKGKGVLG